MRTVYGVLAATLAAALWGCGGSGAHPEDTKIPSDSGATEALSGTWQECGAVSLPDDGFGPARPNLVGLAASPDGRWLVDTTMHVAQAWHVAQTFSDSTPAWRYDLSVELYPAFSPDGAFVAISGDGREVLDTATGARVYAPDDVPTLPPAPLRGCDVWYLAFARHADWVAGGNCDRGVQVFSLSARQLVAELPSGSLDTGAAFSPDDTLVATGVPELYRTSDWSRVWPAAVTKIAAGDDGTFPLNDVSFTPDGEELVVTSCSGDPRVPRCETRVHSVQSGARIATLPLTGPRPSFSPDGAWLVAGGDVFHRASGRLVHLGDFSAATFAPNGDIFAGTADGVVKRLCATR